MTVTASSLYDNCATPTQAPIVAELDARIESVMGEFLASPIWHALESPSTPPSTVKAILREVYYEVCCYQVLTTRAGFLWIGSIEPAERKVMKTLLLHKWDEVEHLEWARQGFISLGGDPSRLSNLSMSPESHAVAAVWRSLAETAPPLSYIGAEYLFEALTAAVTKVVVPKCRNAGMSRDSIYFVEEHATEDVKHTNLFTHLAADVCVRHPELAKPILYAFDCFHAVYPMPVWMAAFRRANGTVR